MKTPLLSKSIFASFLLLLFLAPIQAAWQLPIDNYSPKDYAAGTQNWQLAISEAGALYAANNYGLLEYTGAQWRLYGLKNSSVVRSVQTAPWGDVFAGGTNEFGYFHTDSYGEMHYVSISDSLPEEYRNFGEVWNIIYNDERLYLQTRHYLFTIVCPAPQSQDAQLRFSHLKVLNVNQRIFCMSCIDNGIYVGTGDGVFMLSGSSLNRLHDSNQLHGSEIRCMKQLGANQVLIATDLKGLFLYDGNSLRPFRTEADEYFLKNQLYSVAVNDDVIAVGTVLGGVVTMDKEGKHCRYFGVKSGLNNQTVLSLCFDRNGNLWAGLDQGISRLALRSPLKYLNTDGVACGSGYTTAVSAGQLYLGTNQGLFMTNVQGTAPLQLVAGSMGQVWTLAEIDNELFCCHNRGLFRVVNNRLQALSQEEGFWKVKRLDATTAIAGSYSGFYLMRYDGKAWQLMWKIAGFADTALRFEPDAAGNIWVDAQEGVLLLTLSESKRSFHVRIVLPKEEHAGWSNILRLGDKIVVCVANKVYVADEQGQLKEDPAVLDLLDGEKYYPLIYTDNSKNIWFISDDMLCLRRYLSDGGYAETAQAVYDGTANLIGGFEHVNAYDAEHLLIANVDGFCQLTSPFTAVKADSPHRSLKFLRISFQDSNGNMQLAPVEADRTFSVPNDRYNVRFEYVAGGADDLSWRYQVRLSPAEKSYSTATAATEHSYTVLKAGSYIFSVKAQNIYTGEEREQAYAFVIQRPWYLTNWAFAGYVLLFFLLLFGTYRYIKREQHRMELLKNIEINEQEKKYKEEQHRQQMRILELENERVQYELKNKSQELSHLLLNQMNRNELVTDISKDLRKVEAELREGQPQNAQERLQRLQHKLSGSRQNDVDWGQFEANFDIVNDRFMRKLQQRYPWMNKNEKKLCVYIHMGLLTKEIAPLMNMSTRGVEMMRYRLRKKMELDEQANMKEFFASLIAEMEEDVREHGK